MLHRDQGVQVEVELAADELRALVCRYKACELTVQDALHLLLNDNLLRLVEFEVAIRTLTLPRVS